MIKLASYRGRVFQAYLPRVILCLLSLILPAEAFGTAAVMIRTDQQIVIAADSLDTNGHGQTNGSICKIFSTNNLFFVPSGFIIGAGPSGYDAIAITREVANESKAIEETVRRFIDTIRSPLAANLKSVRETNPE